MYFDQNFKKLPISEFLSLIAPAQRGRRASKRNLGHQRSCVFLFDQDRLVDANTAGRDFLLRCNQWAVSDWARLADGLCNSAPGFPISPPHLAPGSRLEVKAKQKIGAIHLTALSRTRMRVVFSPKVKWLRKITNLPLHCWSASPGQRTGISETAHGPQLSNSVPPPAPTAYAYRNLFDKTPWGVVVFSPNHHLQYFNTALINLTGIVRKSMQVGMSLRAFCDQLRAAKAMPEPTTPREWRAHIAKLEASSMRPISETWHLPNGQVIRVMSYSGPDHSYTFEFHDVSLEVAQTRRFRNEVALSHTILDSLGMGIAIFGQDRHLLQTNRIYEHIWHTQTLELVSPLKLEQQIGIWRGQCQDGSFWRDISKIIVDDNGPIDLCTQLYHVDHGRLACRLKPVADKYWMFTFHHRDIAGGAPI